jgi:hypothetical protein
MAILGGTAHGAPASTTKGNLNAVWQGTLGTTKIMACFDADDISYYYYVKYRQVIDLHKTNSVGWTENDGDKVLAHWTFDGAASPDQLHGQWSDAAGKRYLPIELTRIDVKSADSDDDGPCASDAFNQILEGALKVVTSGEKTFNGRRYREISAQADNLPDYNVTTLELIGSGAAIASINQALRLDLPDSPAKVTEFYFCHREAMRTGDETSESLTVQPTIWTATLLEVTRSESEDCGGAHPGATTTSVRMWNPQTGRPIDIGTWFTAAALVGDAPADPADEVRQVSANLQKVILSLSDDVKDGDCSPSEISYEIHPDKAAMVFTPQSVDLPCDDDIAVPYGKMLPFLSGVGKAGLQALKGAK